MCPDKRVIRPRYVSRTTVRRCILTPLSTTLSSGGPSQPGRSRSRHRSRRRSSPRKATGMPGGEGVPALPRGRGIQTLTAARFPHRCPRRGRRLPTADARHGTVPDVLPQPAADHATRQWTPRHELTLGARGRRCDSRAPTDPLSAGTRPYAAGYRRGLARSGLGGHLLHHVRDRHVRDTTTAP